MIIPGRPEEGLLPHQLEAFQAITNKFEESDKAAMILPTGCGKSFVAMQMLAENPNKRMLFIASNLAIENQMYEYIAKYMLDKNIDNMDAKQVESLVKEHYPDFNIVLYQSIKGLNIIKNADNDKYENIDFSIENFVDENELGEESIKDIQKRVEEEVKTLQDDQDIVIWDELHRAGAKQWGEELNTFMGRSPNAKLLGMTATPERMDGKNMIDYLFDGEAAYQMNLKEAFERGILQRPICYGYGKTMMSRFDKLTKKFKKGLVDKDKIQEECDNSADIRELLNSCITKKDGRYVVFCKNITELKKTEKLISEWFKDIDDAPEIYSIHSKKGKKDNEQEIKDFEQSDSEHIKLLLSVDKVNEGLHVKGVTGVILNKATNSPIKYLQQIGRTMAADGGQEQKIIIDLVNNWMEHNRDGSLDFDVIVNGKVVNRNGKEEKDSIGKAVDSVNQIYRRVVERKDIIKRCKYINHQYTDIAQDAVEFAKENGKEILDTNSEQYEKFQSYKNRLRDVYAQVLGYLQELQQDKEQKELRYENKEFVYAKIKIRNLLWKIYGKVTYAYFKW